MRPRGDRGAATRLKMRRSCQITLPEMKAGGLYQRVSKRLIKTITHHTSFAPFLSLTGLLVWQVDKLFSFQ